ncbi:hypothetical protein DDB_G0281699 [Dictyostelium discoideum AX4]|uniref:Small ribosomal subunit protein mS29 n=1 Tax=Dictyostelium discoideum TaxID=44689 RepID=Q54TK2_DICDI|nr:hypothetical protein DDB_G0281699 [Dictyostelium discoideum AX4]EAL66611.1 hypothetical protein DDB_G0281699 [Dictyostelium discoideum AX4]|eukprot:XP_640589.1 hypothetical protein DDB_G0281699 [Dictyostelium discoideum AX4]
MSFIRGVCKLSKNIRYTGSINSILNKGVIGSTINTKTTTITTTTTNTTNNTLAYRNYCSSTTTTTTTNTTQNEIKEVPYQFLTLTNEQWELALGKEVNKNTKDFFDLTKSRTTLLRKPTFETIQWLSKMKEQRFYKESPQDYCRVLDGVAGSGKSISLAQVAFWAQQQDWLVVYIPNASSFINRGALTHFNINPLLFAQNNLCFNFIKQFVEVNHAKLREIKLKTKFKIESTGWESSPNKTLFDLLSSTKYDSSSEIFYHFKRELNTIHEFPVLVAIDGFNHFYRPSDYGDMYDSASNLGTLPTDRLMASSLFKNITSHQISNGVVLAATTNVIPKREMFEVIPEESVLNVPIFTIYEFKLFINYLVETKYLEKSPNQETIEYYWQISSGNPRELWKILRILH